jgi:hypothetical protein
MKNILRPTKVKVILHLSLSLGLVLAIFFLPISKFLEVFNSFSLMRKILSFSLSWLFIAIVYYPLTASLIYLAGSIKKSIYSAKEIIFALILIAIFNPFTITYVFSKINIKKNIPADNVNVSQNNNQPTCGLMINEFLPNSKLAEAGINKGDVILKFNGAEVKIVQDIFDQLVQKKPGDKVAVETNKGIKTVELAKDSADSSRPVLGVKLLPNPCKNN